MATRNISTRLAVEGESQYKAAITSINAELKNMQSALKLTESQFKSNANSTEALTAKGKALNDLLATQKSKVTALEAGLKNAQEAEARYAQKKEELTRKIQQNSAALEKLKTSTGDTTKEQQRLEEENAKLNQELERNENYLNAAHRAVNNWAAAMNKAQAEVNETESALRETETALQGNAQALDKTATAFDAVASALVAKGLKQSFKEISDALKSCVDASVSFESAMAGVAKTTDLSDTELAQMGQSIKDLTTQIPITATEFARIVEVAGQLGIEKNSLLDFATVMANLGVATNLTSEQAATMLAQFANITKMAPEMYQNLGSVIVALGNNFATNENAIVSMGQRLAAAGELAGLTEPEIMALATAMSSVGIEAEAGGTAMTQTLTAMEKAVAGGGDQLQKFADVAGMSAEDFANAWKSSPITAIESFIEGLGRLNDQGESATLILDDMGLTGIRQGNMLKSLASASDLLSNAVATANIAWEQNTALVNEARTRYETTESKLTLFKNAVDNLKISIGDQLTPALGKLADEGTDVVSWATDFVKENEWLAPTITAVASALGVLTAATSGAIVVTKILIPLIQDLNTTMLANPAFWVVAGFAALAAAAVTLAQTLPSTTKEADALNDAMATANQRFSDAQEAFDKSTETIDATANVIDRYINRLDELNEKESLTKQEQSEYNILVDQLRDLLPDVQIQMDNTTGRLITTTEELRNGAEAWKEYARQQAFATIFAEQQAALTDLTISLEKGRMQMAEYNETATDGMYTYIEALRAQEQATEEYVSAGSGGKWLEYTEEYAAAQAKYEAATKAVREAKADLTKEEAANAEAMLALEDAMAQTEAQIDAQSEALLQTQAAMDEYMNSVDQAAEKTGEMADDLDAANEAMSTIGDGADEAVQQIPAAMETAMTDTSAAVEAAAPEIQAQVGDIGTQSASEFESGLQGASDAARQTMSDVNQTVRSAAADARSAGYSVGAAISQGAAAGVRAYAAQVAAEAAQMVTDAINAAKNAAQSASPSKKMIRLGQDIDRGLIVGIKDLETEVLQQMRGTMGKVVTVQVDPPEIPDCTGAILQAMEAPTGHDAGLSAVVSRLDKIEKRLGSDRKVEVTQIINAEDTSYAGQQREAKRRFREVSRELMN